MTNEQVVDAIGTIYETALNIEAWPDALEYVANCTGGAAAVFMLSDPVLAELEALHVDRPHWRGRPSSYTEGRLAGAEKAWLRYAKETPAQRIFSDLDVWPDRSIYNNMPSVAWLKRGGLYHRNAVRLCDHGGWLDTVAVLFAADRGGMTGTEKKNFQTLLPHLARTIEIQRGFTLLRNRYQAVLSVLDRLGIGVAILDGEGGKILHNREAERIFDAEDGVSLAREGRITVRNETARLAFGDAVFKAAKTARKSGSDHGSTVMIERPSGADAYVVDVSPMRISNADYDRDIAGVAVFLVDPAHRAMVSTAGLSKAFNLTGAEAEICRLIAEGLTGREIADHQNVSYETVKTHNRSILRKSGARNRIELVRRALAIVPPIVDADNRREN